MLPILPEETSRGRPHEARSSALLPTKRNHRSSHLRSPPLRRQQIKLRCRIPCILNLQPYPKVIESSPHRRRNRHNARSRANNQQICNAGLSVAVPRDAGRPPGKSRTWFGENDVEQPPCFWWDIPLALGILKFSCHCIVAYSAFCHGSFFVVG